jgi:hypothetical protein
VARAIADRMRCPAICRDQIKEGMVHAYGADFEPAAAGELAARRQPFVLGHATI